MTNRTFSTILATVALAFVVAGGLSCGSDKVGDNDWELDEANEGDKDAGERDEAGEGHNGAAGCEFDRECPDGMYCYGPTQCGATWSCQEGFPPCSAAPPSKGCSCDGEVVSLAAGCPPRHAWKFVQIRLFTGFSDELWGEPCDADLQFPFTVSLAFTVDGFGSDVAGQQVRIRFENPSIHAGTGEFDASVAADGSLDFGASFDYEEHTEVALLFWWDRDGDGECSDEDLVWRGIPYLEDGEIDLETLEGFEGEATVDVRHLSEEQGFEEGAGCERWNSLD